MKRLIGDRQFYKAAFALAIPVMLQNGITSFVSLLDNLMVGSIGTEQMSGVAISNQLMFVFNLCVFGAVSGAGIFTAQFHGAKDTKGVRETFRFKIMTTIVLVAASIALFWSLDDTLISLFLTEEPGTDMAATLNYGCEYLDIMLIGLVPFALVQAYSSTLREVGETRLPMIAGTAAVLINLFFNYTLIFGHFGAPALGVSGAAIATVISRFAELAIVVIAVYVKREVFPFIKGAFKSLYVQPSLVKGIILKGLPLMLNELLWSMSVTVLMECYSTRGLSVVAAYNINNTVSNLFTVVFLSMGNVVAIIIGHQLGSGHLKEAKDTAPKLIFLCTALAFGVACVLAAASPFIPMLYNVTDHVRSLASSLILCNSLMITMHGLIHSSYFTIRSGGRTMLTFIYDNGFTWIFSVPLAFALSRFTDLPIIPLFLICQSVDIIKCVIGVLMVRSGCWVRNLVGDSDSQAHPEAVCGE